MYIPYSINTILKTSYIQTEDEDELEIMCFNVNPAIEGTPKCTIEMETIDASNSPRLRFITQLHIDLSALANSELDIVIPYFSLTNPEFQYYYIAVHSDNSSASNLVNIETQDYVNYQRYQYKKYEDDVILE